jgi:type II secretory pathway component HofQ
MRSIEKRMALALVLQLAASLPVRAGGGDPPQALLETMAQGKVDADLGNHDAATQAFSKVARSPDAPAQMQGEALARLAAARRSAGDYEGALRAFDEAWKHALQHDDPETLRLAVLSLSEPMPSMDRWTRIWKRVSFRVDRSDPAHPTHKVLWPDVPPRPRGYKYKGHPISFDFKDGDLADVIRLFAGITGLNVVIDPGVRGKLSFTAQGVPWDRALDAVLAPQGLTFRVDGNVLRIGRPESLGMAATSTDEERTPRYTGQVIDVDLQNADLRQGLSQLAAHGNATVNFDPSVKGRFTITLKRVPWDQAFDLVLKTNGIASKRSGKVIEVGPRPVRSVEAAHPVTLDIKDGDLLDTTRLLADIAGFDVVVDPDVHGHVTVKLRACPWNEALLQILAPQGLTYRLDGKVLYVGRPENLNMVGVTVSRNSDGSKQYRGQRIDVHMEQIDIRDALEWIATQGGVKTVIDASVHGPVTLHLPAVPWDQAFDLATRTNGLKWTRSGNTLTVSPRDGDPR